MAVAFGSSGCAFELVEEAVSMEIAVVVAVVLVLFVVQVRRRGSRLQRADDPRAHVNTERGNRAT